MSPRIAESYTDIMARHAHVISPLIEAMCEVAIKAGATRPAAGTANLLSAADFLRKSGFDREGFVTLAAQAYDSWAMADAMLQNSKPPAA